eukprot:14937546-Alexandrium_andersonii.AAC.1
MILIVGFLSLVAACGYDPLGFSLRRRAAQLTFAYAVAYLFACSGGPSRDWTRLLGRYFILGTIVLVLAQCSSSPAAAFL